MKLINGWFIMQKKKKILRLKGGDPSFFSRGSQEIDFLKKNSINFRVFTGVMISQQAIKVVITPFTMRVGM